MENLEHTLERLLAQVRKLPEERQLAVVEAIKEITEEPYQLSDDELSVLRPALFDAQNGLNLTDAETDPALNALWR